MVEYSNPKVPDEVNITRNSSAYDLVLLGLLAIGSLAALVFLVFFLGGFLGRLIPFETERNMVAWVDEGLLEPATEGPSGALQELVDRLTPHMDLPEGMSVVVRYEVNPLVNAFATVGGQITIMSGLIDEMESENELAMVLAHEMAHIKHRDVASALGGSILLGLSYSLIFGDSSAGGLFTNAGGLMQLSFSRDAERAADLAALEAVTALYGHGNGSIALYEILRDAETEIPGGWLNKAEVLRTHPNIENRIEYLEQAARAREINMAGPLTPLPTIYQAELTNERGKPKETKQLPR